MKTNLRRYLWGLRWKSEFIASMVLGTAAAWSQLASAHHSFLYLLTPDGEQTIQVVEGTVRVLRILNPHGAIMVDGTNESGASEGWLIELNPAAQIARDGWRDDMLSPRDKVMVAIYPSSTPSRARLRAMLIHGKAEREAAQLFVAYGIRGDTPVMRRLRERLPVCGVIDASYNGTECFFVDSEALRALEEEFPGQMGYVMP